MRICFSKRFELVNCEVLAVELTKIMKDDTPTRYACQPGVPIIYPLFNNTYPIGTTIVPKPNSSSILKLMSIWGYFLLSLILVYCFVLF